MAKKSETRGPAAVPAGGEKRLRFRGLALRIHAGKDLG
jgi:hypothetical protein